MTEAGLEHTLFAAALVGRLGDIGSTYLATPKLKLEANPIVRKLRWPFAFATVLVCLVPYWSTSLGIVVIVVSYLVTSQNLRSVWLARALGEDEFLDLYVRAARNSTTLGMLAPHLARCFFLSALAGLLFFFYPRPTTWAYWFAVGIAAFAFAMLLHGSSFIRRIRRLATEPADSIDADGGQLHASPDVVR